jgi:2,4-dienoyl-CoA reductase-like NADH-dependent reductase (Old Yellow Enzyme family)
MKNDSPPWQEDPKNPTRRSGEKRKDKYGNEIKNVAKHLARKAMNAVKESVNKNAAVAKKAGAKLKMDPDTGTPDHFTAALRRKKGLDEAANSVHAKSWYETTGERFRQRYGCGIQESN